MSPAPASTTALPEGALTVTAAVPLWPSLVAVIVAVPAPCPVTSPLPLTVATAALSLDQTIARPASGAPLASRGVAVRPIVWPTTIAADDGVTVTDATGVLATVTVAVPLFPSLVAVIVAVPTATPVTRPVAETEAIPGALLAQAIARPVSGAPLASRGVAVSCAEPFTWRFSVAGLTVTDATGTGATVIAAVPLWPSLVAVIVAVPAATPVTSPLAFTVATDVLLDDQVTVRPVRALPAESFGVAVSCTLAPT